jgi:hypothetical protein
MSKNYLNNSRYLKSSYEPFENIKQENNYYVVPKIDESPISTESILQKTSAYSFLPQREGLSVEGHGYEKELKNSYFFENYKEFHGKYYYPFIDGDIYYYPHFFKDRLYYYPFSATDKCFCMDDNLPYKVNVSENISGQCLPCYQCKNCNMDFYFMCQNVFPMSG